MNMVHKGGYLEGQGADKYTNIGNHMHIGHSL